jgi:hypothetical protein
MISIILHVTYMLVYTYIHHIGLTLNPKCWKMEHMLTRRSLTFSLITPDDKWISLSPKIFLAFDGHYHCWFNSHKYGVTNIDDNNISSNNGCLEKDMIICQDSYKW